MIFAVLARRVIAVSLAALAFPVWASAQPRIADVGQALGALQAAAEALPADARLPELLPAINWLINRAAKTDAKQVSPEYVRSLQRAADLLRLNPGREVIADITSELEAKVDHCRALGLGMGGSVLLRINTRRGSQPIGDLQVFYLLKFYERLSATEATTFPKLSSPTETRVEPGRYWLWARDPASGRTSDRVLVRIAGQSEFIVDLAVP
jgi:hypothetical protein